MQYNFDEIIDRRNTNSLKYDFFLERGYTEDTLPMWVADMDFSCPDEVKQSLKKYIDKGIFGYCNPKENYYIALNKWFNKHFDFDIKKEWVVITPGVVFALANALRSFTKENDKILIQSPVYYPFSQVIESNNRKVVRCNLVYENNSYHIDFNDFENKIITNDVKLFILCNPHNPIGKEYKKEDLIRMADICKRNNVIIVSDEIHADFTYPGVKHNVLVNISEEYKDFVITCTAPSKTFNLAGLQISNIIIKSEKLRNLFIKELEKTAYTEANCLAIVACSAAYSHGEKWLSFLKEYLYQNLLFLEKFIKENMPKVKLVKPDATYLVWLDFNDLDITNEELKSRIKNDGKLWLDDGDMFGDNALKFERINIACPRKTLEEGLKRLAKVVEKI